MKNEQLEKEVVINYEIKKQFLHDEAVKEMQKQKKLTKKTFKGLLIVYNVTYNEIINYFERIKLKECGDCSKFDSNSNSCSKCFYDKSWEGSQISRMITESVLNRNPTPKLSEVFLKYLQNEKNANIGKLSGKIAKEIKSRVNREYEEDECEYINQEEELTKIRREELEILLSDTMLNILYENFILFKQFGPNLWSTIKKLEQCKEIQLFQVMSEFCKKDNVEKLKSNEELYQLLVFSWNYDSKNRENLLNDVLKLWGENLYEIIEREEGLLNGKMVIPEQKNMYLWDNLEVFGNMNEKVWWVIIMIIVEDLKFETEDLSPKTMKKISKILN